MVVKSVDNDVIRIAAQLVFVWAACYANPTHAVAEHRSMAVALTDFPADGAQDEVLATVWLTTLFVVH